MQQAQDFREESRALAALIEPLTDADFQRVTLFKQWTINDVLGHLHMFNVAAHATLESPEHFQAFFAPIAEQLQQGRTLLQSQGPWLKILNIKLTLILSFTQMPKPHTNYRNPELLG